MKDEKRIAVIFTGGTIGSRTADGVIDLDPDAPELLLTVCRNRYSDLRDVSFSVYRPIDVLSENMTPYEFGKIAECVSVIKDDDDVSGIILTHGTDTLTFSANALSLIFADIDLPLVLVSADKPVSEGGNGVANFKAAADFIALGIPGVFVAYQNYREPMRIHLGSRLTESEQLTGRVHSVGGLHFGSFEGGRFIVNRAPGNVTEKELSEHKKPSGLTTLSSDVVTITPHTALDFGYYAAGDKVPAVYIVKLFHSGTCSGAKGKYGVADFIDRAYEKGAVVVLASFPSDAAPYGSSVNIYKKAIVNYDTSFENCVAKVMLALGSGVNIETALSENYAFERLKLR